MAAIAKAGIKSEVEVEDKKSEVIAKIIDSNEKGEDVEEVIEEADLPFEVDTADVREEEDDDEADDDVADTHVNRTLR